MKAKLRKKAGKKTVKTDDGEKFLVNAYLGDPHGTIEVHLWELFCEEGRIQHQRYNLGNTQNWVQSCRDCTVQRECDLTF